MKKASLFFLLLLGFFALESSPVQAEYRAKTKFTAVEMGGEEDGQPPGYLSAVIDEVDEKACLAITENINAMQNYHIQWECDFPISANNYLLTKPQWTEVAGEEKRKALDVISPNRQGNDWERVSVYGFPYNVDTIEGDEKIYITPYQEYKCKTGSTESRVSFWFSEKNNLFVINSDPVIFSSRMYFVEYNRSGKDDKSFNVATMRHRPSSNGTEKNQYNVCTINPAVSK